MSSYTLYTSHTILTSPNGEVVTTAFTTPQLLELYRALNMGNTITFPVFVNRFKHWLSTTKAN